MPKVSMIIPTLNAEREIGGLLDALLDQTVAPDEILIVDSSSDDGTQEIIKSYADRGVCLLVIDRSDFDHGGTRAMAVEHTTGDFILFMTQDALPADTSYVEMLLQPFANENVALVYGRQLPKPDAYRYVELVQAFNYPAEPSVRTAKDIERLGIKAFFCSDVCSAYRRSAYEAVGGFDHPLNTNEDMLIASKLLKRGYSVAYESSARVIHSHNLTFLKQFKRNKEVGIFLKEHHAAFKDIKEIEEGKKLVIYVIKGLIVDFQIRNIILFLVDCCARLLGNKYSRLRNR